MPYKDKDLKRKIDREYYQRNKEEKKEKVRARAEEISFFISEYKAKRSCIKCGESDVITLDFHHRDPSTKKYTISQMRKHSMPLLLEEIEKCDILCSNCHRKLHRDMKLLERCQNGIGAVC